MAATTREQLVQEQMQAAVAERAALTAKRRPAPLTPHHEILAGQQSHVREVERTLARQRVADFPQDGSPRERVEWVAGTATAPELLAVLVEDRPQWRQLVLDAERAGANRLLVLQALAGQ